MSARSFFSIRSLLTGLSFSLDAERRKFCKRIDSANKAAFSALLNCSSREAAFLRELIVSLREIRGFSRNGEWENVRREMRKMNSNVEMFGRSIELI